MKKIYFIILFLIILNCKKETLFDDNEVVNNQIKKGLYEYILLTKIPRKNIVITIQRSKKADSIEFLINARNSISLFKEDHVCYRLSYLNTLIFSNYKNSIFSVCLNLKEAAKYLNKDEYEYFVKNNKVPPPYILLDVMQLKMVFVNSKLTYKEYDY